MEICSIHLAKAIKAKGYNKPTHYYYLDKDLPFVKKGLKSCKNDERLNHNAFDDFVYSAPTIIEAVMFLRDEHLIDWKITKSEK